jgi:hypothetical protein
MLHMRLHENLTIKIALIGVGHTMQIVMPHIYVRNVIKL